MHLKRTNLELLHYKSFGHPFYQNELALERRRLGQRTIFIAPRTYKHMEVIRYIRKEFLVILVPEIVLSMLKILGLKQKLTIDHEHNYSQLLEKRAVDIAADESRNLERSCTFYIHSRSLVEGGPKKSRGLPSKSARDSQVSYFDKTIEKINSLQETHTLSAPENTPHAHSTLERKTNTIIQIKYSKIYIGTNTGPYVCAMSLGKPALIINVIPYLGTHSYHKSYDWHIPILIYSKTYKRLLTIHEIISERLHLLDDSQLPDRFEFRKVSEEVVSHSVAEYLSVYLDGFTSYQPTRKQIHFREYLQNSTTLGQIPLFPNAYIDAYPDVFQ